MKQVTHGESYDEVFTKGKPRPHFKQAWAAYSRLTRKQKRRREQLAAAAFDGDAPVLGLPRVLTRAEYLGLRKGVEQRGRAFQKFLHDHYFGTKRYRKHNLFPPGVLRQIINRANEQRAAQVLRRENLQFWYAPDIMRDRDGLFRVIEDNMGFVGCIGDLRASAKAALALGVPSQKKYDPDAFYRKLTRHYKREAKRHGGEKIILLSYDPAIRVTHEDERLKKICADFGISCVEDPTKLTYENNKVYHQGERVSFVLIDVDTSDVEPGSPFTYQRYLSNLIAETTPKQKIKLTKLFRANRERELVNQLKKLGTDVAEINKNNSQGFWTAVRDGNVGVTYPIGLEFVNDKEFYIYVEKLIRFYLREEPLLKNIETRSFVDKRLSSEVFAEKENWVIKGTSGRGGEEVWLGRLLNSRQIKKLQMQVALHPNGYIAQRFVAPSQLLDYSVDLRLFAMISPNIAILSPTIWGRAIRQGGSGKVNISGGGKLNAVVVSPD